MYFQSKWFKIKLCFDGRKKMAKDFFKNLEFEKKRKTGFEGWSVASLRKRESILDSLDSIVYGGGLSTMKSSKRFLTLSRAGYSKQEIAEELGVSYSRVRGISAELDRFFGGLVGENFFELLRTEEGLEECEATVMMIGMSFEEFILEVLLRECADFMKSVPDGGRSGIRIEDCKEEMKFLMDYSRLGMEKRLGNLDAEKIAYLKTIMESSKEDSATERLRMYNILKYGRAK